MTGCPLVPVIGGVTDSFACKAKAPACPAGALLVDQSARRLGRDQISE